MNKNDFEEDEQIILKHAVKVLRGMTKYPLERMKDKHHRKRDWKDAKKLNPDLSEDEYFRYLRETTTTAIEKLDKVLEKLGDEK